MKGKSAQIFKMMEFQRRFSFHLSISNIGDSVFEISKNHYF